MPAQTRRAATLFAFLLLALTAVSLAEESQDVDLQWGVRIPMRDGVELAATLYRPAGQKEPLPVVFTLTPYIGDTYHPRALYFARHGYVYDPLDVRPEELEREDVEKPITDQRYALNLFGDGLVYHSEPFTEATEVSGQVKLTLWIALDVPDTDLKADLYEILPDGGSIALTSDLVRARYRESREKETLVPPGKALRYEFTGFSWFSRRVAKGSRLRLVVSCPNSIYAQKNYNSGGVVADETAKEARTAHVVLYHDAEHPSALEIPVVPGS